MARNIRIKVARAEKDMTQGELAARVNVSRQTVNAIEQGEYNPTIKLCRAICRVLGKTLDELFWEDDDEKCGKEIRRETAARARQGIQIRLHHVDPDDAGGVLYYRLV